MESALYLLFSGNFTNLLAQAASPVLCNPTEGAGSFFGLPYWYQYLDGVKVETYDPLTDTNTLICSPHLNGFGDIWLVALAVIDIILRIVGIMAVGWIIWGGIQYMTSQGEPDRTKAAKDTVLNAAIGLIICTMSVVIISFLGNSF